MKILHLTYDFPDAINPNKTSAIKNIIDITGTRDNTFCISLNRTTGIKNRKQSKTGNVISVETFGFPKGIFLKYTLENSIRSVISTGLDIKSFDKIHAHKLSFEGPIAYHMHKKYCIPYVVSIQQTDFKVLKYKPLMRGYYFDILKAAESIVLISPWMEKQLEKYFGKVHVGQIRHKISCVPLAVGREKIFSEKDNGKFLCVFHMRKGYLKIKNIYRLLKAISILKKSGTIIHLDIAGDGEEKGKLERMIARLGLNAQVNLLGKVDNNRITHLMSNYRAFVLCSYPETFGMVFVEALTAGIPVIYSKDSGIDGYFDNMGVGIAVRHDSVSEICAALLKINCEYRKLKVNIHNLHNNGYLQQFSNSSVRQKYKLLYGV